MVLDFEWFFQSNPDCKNILISKGHILDPHILSGHGLSNGQKVSYSDANFPLCDEAVFIQHSGDLNT